MSNDPTLSKTPKSRLLSVDTWAVVAALLAALLIRAGVLTRVPW
jgi:hypothetical protein